MHRYKRFIASFDMELWIKLYMVDDEFKTFTLSNSKLFNNLFYKQSNTDNIRPSNLIILDNKLCKVNSISCTKTPKNRKYHICVQEFVTNKFYEVLIINKTIIIYK